MIVQVMCVYDSAADAYNQPFYTNAIGQAIRSFSDSCSDKNHAFYKHAKDFYLYHLGTFDDQTGKFSMLKEPKRISHAKDFVLSQDIKVGDINDEMPF